MYIKQYSGGQSMARKDLNLSLDQSLIHQRHLRKLAPAATDAPDSQKPGKQTTAAAAKPRQNIQTITISIIAVTNMAFLLVAGIWLSTLQYTIAGPTTTPIPPALTPRVESMLAEANERLGSVQRQLDELKLTFDAHQLLAASAYAEMEKEVRTVPAQENGSAKPVSTKEFTTAVDNWYVNLGTFSSEEAAASLQRQLHSIGRRAQISQQTNEGKIAYELRLSGFDDRESAEMTAGEIMKQTDLNGLWVWKKD